jgi:pre-rRNA-processing protein TSR3
VSKIAEDPTGGLASVEALYLARLLLGSRDDSLLDDYYWRDPFMRNLERAGLLPGR